MTLEAAICLNKQPLHKSQLINKQRPPGPQTGVFIMMLLSGTPKGPWNFCYTFVGEMLISPAMVLQKQMRLITFQTPVTAMPYKQTGKDTGASFFPPLLFYRKGPIHEFYQPKHITQMKQMKPQLKPLLNNWSFMRQESSKDFLIWRLQLFNFSNPLLHLGKTA